MSVSSVYTPPRKRPLSFERVQQIRRDREARGLLTPAPQPQPKTPWQILKEADAAIARRKREKSDAGIDALNRTITVMRVAMRVAFPQEAETKRPKVADIQHAVAAEFGVTRDDIIGSSRKARETFPRQVAMWITKDMTVRSSTEIGRHFGGRDHTTALHGINKIAALRESDAELRARIDAIMERVREG